jgi:hypothetical protein
MKTIKVRMLTIWASAHGCFGPGQCVELPEELANKLIKARSAEPVGGAAKPRAVTGTTSHQAPPAASTATNHGRETADADPHKGRVKLVRDPDDAPDPEEELEELDDDLDDETEDPDEELPEEDEEDAEQGGGEADAGTPPVNPLAAIPDEPDAGKPAPKPAGKAPKAPRAGRSKAKKG